MPYPDGMPSNVGPYAPAPVLTIEHHQAIATFQTTKAAAEALIFALTDHPQDGDTRYFLENAREIVEGMQWRIQRVLEDAA